ncbi:MULTISPECIES: hypothetical protein [Hyphobacterium]|uniref:Uncharacterized protein n=1 Tax=Hyphobacterium vulgare TaxID=1736751 RepID=A0ABV7A1C9_9PROT
MPENKVNGVALVMAATLVWLNSPAANAAPWPLAQTDIRQTPHAAKQDSGLTAAEVRQEQRRQADLVEAVLDEIEDFTPDHRAFIADNDQAQADAMEALEVFRERMAAAITADLVAMAADTTNSYAARTATAANRHAAYTERTISSVDLDRFRNSGGRDDLAIAQYFLMAYRAEQMRQLARLYPQSEPVAQARQVADRLMAELGSLESVIEGREAAQAARIAEMRLYPAVRSDPATEQNFAAAFAASIWTQGEFAGSEIVRVNLISPGWTVRRNPITGVILSRDQRADLGVRRRDGRCFSYVVEFEQSYQGGGYGGTRMASGRDLEMLCENITP